MTGTKQQRTVELISIFTVLLLLVSCCYGQIDCNFPPKKSCAFYDECLEAKYHCGSKGYPIGFGKKFCDIFEIQLTLEERYSPQGQDFLWKNMHCLEVSLVAPLIQNTSSIDCKGVEQTALDSHSSCFIQSGFCNLPLKDKVVIAKTLVGHNISSIFWDFINQIVNTLSTCISQKHRPMLQKSNLS